MKSSSSSSSSSGSGAAVQSRPLVVAATPTPPPDSCTWYQGQVCGRPRSCFDCLNIALANGTQCTINPYGECVPLHEYSWRDDFRLHDETVLYSFYPSTNTSYCSQTDPGCVDCRLRLVKEKQGLYGYLYSRSMKAQCLGVDGCVCVAACEATSWRANVLTREWCPASDIDDANHANDSMQTMSFRLSQSAYVLLVLSLGGLMILLVLVRRWWIGHRKGVRRRGRFANLHVKLDGWHSFRQRLIEQENAELTAKSKPKLALQSEEDGETGSNDKGGSGDDPMQDDRDAGLVIEHGDGYRPLSPSEYERHRRVREDSHAAAA